MENDKREREKERKLKEYAKPVLEKHENLKDITGGTGGS